MYLYLDMCPYFLLKINVKYFLLALDMAQQMVYTIIIVQISKKKEGKHECRTNISIFKRYIRKIYFN
jgi:hypothetical protein